MNLANQPDVMNATIFRCEDADHAVIGYVKNVWLNVTIASDGFVRVRIKNAKEDTGTKRVRLSVEYVRSNDVDIKKTRISKRITVLITKKKETNNSEIKVSVFL